MVTRTTTIDNTYVRSTSCGESSSFGYYFQKVQNGGDSPALPRRKKGQKPRFFNPGVDSQHNYDVTIISRANPVISWSFNNNPFSTYSGGVHNCFGYPSSQAAEISQNEINQLVSRLASKVNGGSFNLGASLGEFGESLETIATGAKRIYLAYKSVRKMDIRGLRNALAYSPKGRSNASGPAELWLEYKYGWLPILQDVHDAAQLLAGQIYQPQVRKFTVRKRKEGPLMASGITLDGFGYNSYQIVALVSEPPSAAAALGLTNPLSIAWELLPLSFVLDWVLPIGDYLEARGAASSLRGTFVVTTVKATLCRGASSGSSYTIWSGGESFRYTSIIMKRTVSTSLSSQVGLPELIPFGKAASWQRAVSALSLIKVLSGSR
jgi:hypothetical protein